MKAQPGVWGIDLGQCGLKAIRLQEIEGQLTATAFDYVEHPKILSQPDADPDQLTREALEKFLSRNSLRGDTVAISVPGQSGLARFVKLPPVEEKKIADIVRFEAKQQIPFNLDEVVWDFQKIGAGTVTDGFAMDTEIGLFAMKRDMVTRYLQHFKDVNVEVHLIQMAPLALCNYASYDLLKKENKLTGAGEEAEETETGCVVVLDIGTDSSNLVITDGNKIIWQRPIPLGGNHFTRALTKDLKLTFAKAEHLKRNATKSPDLKKILISLKPVLNDFVSEVQRSLGYFTNTHRDAQVEHLMGVGNAFRLPGLQRFLEEKLGLTVRKLQKMERLAGDTVLTAQVYTENIMTFAVAYGLALQGLKRTRLLTNLLPPEIRTERLIKAKKPWAAASAATLLLGLGALAADYGLSYRAVSHPDVEAAIKKVDAVKKEADAAQTKFETTMAGAKKEEESVRSIVAGQEEFLDWLDFASFITTAVPQPDGGNLPPAAIPGYWSTKPDPAEREKRAGTMSGKEAYDAFKERQKGQKQAGAAGNPMDKSTIRDTGGESLGAGIDDLIQVDIETVDSRYTDDLTAFWRRLREKVVEKGEIRPLAQADQPPEGKGWVIEVRGYTFHNKRRRFLVDTFVENIFRLGMPDFEAGPPKPPAPPPAPMNQPKPMGQPASATSAKPVEQPTPAAPPGSDKGPVRNHISHVVLYQAESEQTMDTRTFKLIHTSVLDKLLGGESSSGDNANQMPSNPGLTTGQVGGGGEGKQGAGGRAGWRSLGSTHLSGALSGTPPSSQAAHTRTEFVILFVWKEPTPSDALFAPAPPHGAKGTQGHQRQGAPTAPAMPGSKP